MSWDLVLETVLFMLLVLVAVNGLVGLACPRARLRRGELVTVLLMLLAAAPAPTIGFLARLLPALGGITYYAPTEPRWPELIRPHVPDWLVISDPDAVRMLFQGAPEDVAIHWRPWLAPLAFWCGFFLVLSLAGIFLAVMLRRQWIERERLAYPIMAAATALVEPESEPGERPFWRRRLLWLGLLVAFGFSSLHPICRYLEEFAGWQFDPPDTSFWWRSPSGIFRLRFKISWAILGLTYLIPLDVSLGCWFFNLLYQLQYSFYQVLGFDVSTYPEPGVWGGPAFSGQAVGAFLFVGVSSFWLGRRHLARIAAAACGRGRYDDADEIIPYRAAFWGFVACCAALLAGMWAMGTPLWLALLVLLIATLSLVALTKIAIHCGLGWMDTPFPACSLATNLVGTQVLSPAATVSLGANWIWTYPMRITALGAVSHGLRAVDHAPARRRGLLAAMVLGLVVALLTGLVFQIWWASREGGVNFYNWFYLSYARQPWRFVGDKLAAPHGPRWAFLGYSAGGLTLAAAFQFLRHRYLWWPFSVVGYAGAFIPTTQKFWFDIFLVWAFKGVLLKYGGMRLYRTFRPFFLGLILGHALTCGVWYVGYLFTGVNGSVPW